MDDKGGVSLKVSTYLVHDSVAIAQGPASAQTIGRDVIGGMSGHALFIENEAVVVTKLDRCRKFAFQAVEEDSQEEHGLA